MARNSLLPTLKDVAELAGVSQTTASMALSGRTGTAHISAACIKRVQKAAKTLGYRGNYHARTLSSGRSYTLGLAVGSGPISVLEHTFFSPICGGVEATARARGYDVLLIGGTGAIEPLVRAIDHLEARRIDGLIVFRALYWRLPARLVQTHLPLVMLDSIHNSVEHPSLQRVVFHDAPGIEAAVAHLAELGHRDLVWLALKGGEGPTLHHRYEAFTRAVAQLGLTGRLILVDPASHGGWGQDLTGFATGLSDLVIPDSSTAILCLNDVMAMGLLAVLAKRQISVPRDLSVIGFDDTYATFCLPELTTITHSLSALGQATVSLAIDIIETGVLPTPPARVQVPSQLIIRASTGPARAR